MARAAETTRGGKEQAAAERRAEAERAARRLRGFGRHLIGYFAVLIVLIVVNYLLTPNDPWFTYPMVAWGAPLAIHAAYAMGLFSRSRGPR